MGLNGSCRNAFNERMVQSQVLHDQLGRAFMHGLHCGTCLHFSHFLLGACQFLNYAVISFLYGYGLDEPL